MSDSENPFMIVRTGKTGPILRQVLDPRSMSVDARPGGFTTGAAETVLRTIKDLHDKGYRLEFGPQIHDETRKMVEGILRKT